MSLIKSLQTLIPTIAIFFTAILVPGVLSAQGINPFPCTGSRGFGGTPCGTCELIQLGNNIIFLLIGLLFIIFAIMAMAAGFQLLTSGGNTSAVEGAKSKMTNAFIGIIIVFMAWIVVDTLFKTLVTNSSFGPWNQIQCLSQSENNLPSGGASGSGGSGGPSGPNPPTGVCSIPGLTPITDPLAQSMEAGNAVIWTNTDPRLQQCVNSFLAAVPGGGSVNSVYRPAEYQTHLWEIRDRWCTLGLISNIDPACSTLKSSIESEVTRHGLSCSRPVGRTSVHTSGRAVDITLNSYPSTMRPPISVQNFANANCLFFTIPSDNVHWELTSNPSCTCP